MAFTLACACGLTAFSCTDFGPIGNQVHARLQQHLRSASIAFGSDLGSDPRIGERFDVEVDLQELAGSLIFQPGDLDLSSCEDGGGDGDDGTDLPTALPTLLDGEEPILDEAITVPVDEPLFAWSSSGTLIDAADESSPVGTFAVSASAVEPGRSPVPHSVSVTIRMVAHPEEVSVLAACGLDRPIVATHRLHLPVPPVPLELPSTLVLFLHRHYEGSVLVYVPSGTPDALAEREGLLRHYLGIERLLEDAQDDVVGLKGDLKFLSLIGPLGIVTDALDDNVVFRRGDQNENLNNIRMRDRFDFDSGILDVEAEDEISSLAFVGTPDAEASLFNEPGLASGQGILHLAAGPGLGVAAGDTHAIRDIVSDGADIVGVGAVFVHGEPHGQRCCEAELFGDQMREIRHFGDEFSSLRFGSPTG